MGEYPSSDDWIVVPKWEQFQHYRDRHPKWIKVYTSLLQKPEFLALSMAERGLLVTIWLLYANENGSISVRFLHDFGPKRNHFRQLVSLNHAGFIRFSASRLLALEKEKELEPLYPLKSQKSQTHLCTFCGLGFRSQTKLDEHLYHQHGGAEPNHWLHERELLRDME